MNELTFDTETTTLCKGHPFHPDNRLCVVGVHQSGRDGVDIRDIEYSPHPYGHDLDVLGRQFKEADRVIGFNLKFDLHWIRRYGIDFKHCRVWDCQLVEFLLSNQSIRYPSLNNVSARYNAGTKHDVVADEYWGNGIDTPDIPYEILSEYLTQDVNLTRKVYECQLEEVNKRSRAFQRLVQLANMDLLVLEEMEWNGMKYDIEQSIKEGDKLERRIKEIESELTAMFPEVPINWGSNDHLSAVLYGGIVKADVRETYTFTYKKGGTAEKTRRVTREWNLPRLVNPLPRTKLAKEGYFSTSEDTLKMLRAKGIGKRIIQLVQERSKLEKQRGTYYHGIPEKAKEKGWEDAILHGQLNQCVAATGRLSSSDPNLQNFSGDSKHLFVTRY